VRAFNANFLARPALPSERLPEACEDKDIVVRAIRTSGHGIYVAVVNTGLVTKPSIRIRLPGAGVVSDAVSGDTMPTRDGILELALHACQLRSLRVR
jgi:hypothetical protein